MIIQLGSGESTKETWKERNADDVTLSPNKSHTHLFNSKE